jgi:uncharacterized delta-60 repeat protein
MSLFSLNRPRRDTRKRYRLRPQLFALEGRVLLTAGAIDTSFGNGGEVLTSFPPLLKGYKGTGGNAFDVEVQSDGKIVAAGEDLHDFALARYNANGSLDSAFGNGGKVVTTFGKNHGEAVRAIAFQPDGKIIAVGNTGVVDAPTGPNFAIARYNTNGTLDTSFGPSHNGLVTTSILGDDHALSVVLQPDGKIVVAGEAQASSSGPGADALVRYNADGSLDTSFGKGGIINMSVVPGADQLFNAVTLETVNVGGVPTTKILASSNSTSPDGIVVVRFNLDGSLDSTFGSGGTVFLQSTDSHASTFGLIVQPDGKIVDSANITNSQGVRDPAVLRLNPDGTLDTSFGPGGAVPGLVDLGFSGFDYRVVLQPDGKILVGGYANSELMLARLNGSDGSLDSTFGTNGVALEALPVTTTVKGMALQSDGKIVTAGVGGINSEFTVARFLGDPPPQAPVVRIPASPMYAARGSDPSAVPLQLGDLGFLDSTIMKRREARSTVISSVDRVSK